MKKIILFELNEVPWRVIKDFTEQYPQSSLAKILHQSRTFETHAEDSELSPWVTWPSAHRGVPDKKHAISNFGQELTETDKEFPPVWKILAQHGISTGIFGSLHTHPVPQDLHNYTFYVPDVFAAGSECFPDNLSAYQQWNLKMSRGSARNVKTGFPLTDTTRFLAGMPGIGVRAKTVIGIAGHLIDERKHNWKKVRRRSQQVIIAFDIFMKQLSKTKPAFSTFFTNHVASSMHRYWAAKFPNDYGQFGYSNEWQTTYHHEIDWTMGKFDQMLNRLLSFMKTNPDYELWIASSMGQAATTAEKPAKCQTYLSDIKCFMKYFGFNSNEYIVKPAMAPRHIIRIENIDRRCEFEQLSDNIFVSDVGKHNITEGENTKVKVKNLGSGIFMIRTPVIQNHTKEKLLIEGTLVNFADLGFCNSLISDQSAQTAYHIPQGSLMIYSPEADYSNHTTESISVLDIAPSVLKNFGIRSPAYMNRSNVSV